MPHHMSNRYQPENPPPPPTGSATLRQILGMLLFGSMGSFFVIQAIKSQEGNSLRAGSILILFAFVFFVGLISKNEVIELIASGVLLLGAGGLVAITIATREWIWGLGAVFFVLCIVVIQLKDRFIDQANTTHDPPSPYR